MAVFLHEIPEGTEHRTLAVISGAERNENGFLDCRASERVTQHPPKVSHQALRAVEIVIRCGRRATNSSPPSRATVSLSRRQALSLDATFCSNWSPASCPSV